MNIEEDDFDEPVRLCGDKLVYVHIGESHRGYLGSGNVDFATFFRVLRETGYAGPIAFESFSSAVVTPDLSNTLGVWRNLWTDNRDLARHAKAYMDRLLTPA
jgi:D-psicose/D-tagatose/L-ribulose 3-epimerase